MPRLMFDLTDDDRRYLESYFRELDVLDERRQAAGDSAGRIRNIAREQDAVRQMIVDTLVQADRQWIEQEGER